VFFFRHLYSISLKLSCFILRAPFPLFYHIFYHFGGLNQRFPKAVVKGECETHDLDFSFCANKLHQEPKKILEN
ncbi:hypothetical protein, partial [uncultured Oscillibacter sp.]